MARASSSAGAEEWFRRARRYLRVAKAVLEDGFADVAAFNAHQAVEFALKALQLHRTGSFTPEEFRALSRRGGLLREALKEGVEVPE